MAGIAGAGRALKNGVCPQSRQRFTGSSTRELGTVSKIVPARNGGNDLKME